MDEQLLQHGMFSWSELMTTDAEAAKHFYAQIFGWQYAEFPMERMTYSVIKAKGQEIGGIMSVPPQAAQTLPHWGVYVTVDDVDASARRAEELGAQVMVPPTDIPDVGRFCVFSDPQGAVISMITYLQR